MAASYPGMDQPHWLNNIGTLSAPLDFMRARTITWQHLVSLFCLWAFAFGSSHLHAQTSAESKSTPEPMPLDEAGMIQELKRLDGVCEKLGLQAEREEMRLWIPPASTDALILYLPLPRDPVPTKSKGAQHDSWLKHFADARSRHAQYWYEQASQSATKGDEWTAYKHLWRAAREDENHAGTKRVLGAMLSGLQVKARPRPSNMAHPQFGWPPGSYSRLETTNFKVTSRADAAQTIEIANRLEAYYALWTQAFYPLWAAPNLTQSRLAGRNTNWSKRNQFDVVLCKDRADYLKTLGMAESNIGVSVGYYNAQAQMAFFYPDDQLDATLYHEVTHQLFSEASQVKSRNQPGADNGFWIVEGVALYMESLKNCRHYWQVGGTFTERIQTARYRSLHDGYWPDWNEFTSGSMESWKSDKDIARLYTHAAGLTHYFLDGRITESPHDIEASRAAYMAALIAVYQGDKLPGTLLELLGGSEAQKRYVNYLVATDQQLAVINDFSPRQVELQRDLVLTRATLNKTSWSLVGKLKQLRWLDVSFSNAQSADLTWISDLSQLERLSLEGTKIDETIVARVARLPKLKELDLSRCNVDDKCVRLLARHPTLEVLWLTGTEVGSDSVAAINSIPKLKFVELTGSKVPPAQIESLQKSTQARKPDGGF